MTTSLARPPAGPPQARRLPRRQRTPPPPLDAITNVSHTAEVSLIPLRPYQHDAVARVATHVRDGHRRVLLVAPTGAGKTVIAAFLIVRNATAGRRILFVAHRRELIDQCYRKLLASGLPAARVGIVMAGDRRHHPKALVQVASIDTLRNRSKPPADLVIVDEAHRALAKSYRDLQEAYPQAIHIGLTATPYRADGRGLGNAYDALVVVASPRQLIDEGFLVEPVVYTVPASHLPDLSRVRLRGGDYDERALAEAVDKRALVGDIVEHWQRRAGGVRTVVFAVSVAHSKHIAERFQAAGVRAEHLDGETLPLERAAILARLERGSTRVVSNVGVLCEGWDQPAVKCCILARPTKSTGLYLQQAGRILRPWTDAKTRKEPHAIILDHAGCALEHGLPQDHRDFSLEDVPKKRRSRSDGFARRAKTCERCFAVVPLATQTCACGFVFGDAVRIGVPEEIEAELVELTQNNVVAQRDEWDRLCATAKQRGYGEAWVQQQYRTRFGHAAPQSFRFPKKPASARKYTDAEKRAYFAKLAATAQERGYRLGFVFVRYRAKFGEAPPADLDAFTLPPRRAAAAVADWEL